MNRSNPNITNPFDAFIASLSEQLAEIKLMVEASNKPDLPPNSLGIELGKAYTPKEVAHLLGTKRLKSIYEIPESELPRVRRIGSGVGFLGVNVLCYMHGLPPVDMDSVIEGYRDSIMQAAPKLKHISSAAAEPSEKRLL